MIEVDCFVITLFVLKLIICWDGIEIHVPDVEHSIYTSQRTHDIIIL